MTDEVKASTTGVNDAKPLTTTDVLTSGTGENLKHREPANIPAATGFSPSGAPYQNSGDVDLDHPAVDANPREHTTLRQNQIDFNDPTISGHEAVRRNLEAQGIKAGPAHDDISRKD